MTFDPSITLGALLNAGVLLVGFVVAFTRIGGRIDLVDQSVESIKETLSIIQRTIADIAAHDKRIAIVEERLNNHAQMIAAHTSDISGLRRGEGYVQSRRKSVDGEYP